MSAYDKLRELFDEIDEIALNTIKEFYEYVQDKSSFLDHVSADIDKFNNEGVLTYNSNNNLSSINEAESSSSISSLKENNPNLTKPEDSNTDKPCRSAFQEATQLNEQAPVTRASRQVSKKNSPNSLSNMMIKVERLTEKFVNSSNDKENLEVKKEVMEMPPPVRPAPKKNQKKRVTASNQNDNNIKIKTELKSSMATRSSRLNNKEGNNSRDSDLEVHSQTVVMISLTDSEEEKEKTPVKHKARPRTKRKLQDEQVSSDNSSGENKSKKICPEQSEVGTTARVTRIKTRLAAKNKETSESEVENAEKQKTEMNNAASTKKPKRTKKTAKKVVANDSSSAYEDALSEPVKPESNKANVEESNPVKEVPNLNETIVIKKPIVSKPANVIEEKDLMTDDEEQIIEPSPKKNTRANKNKPVFSPYESSPVKKRVEAFEKLGVETHPESQPKTRAKGKSPRKEEALNNLQKSKLPTTPTMANNKILTHVSASADKYRYHKGLDGSSGIPTSKSTLKATQAEYHNRELRHKQKEAEALQKKEALIQAQTEERRRKREERQQKAQQTRTALEKDKQYSLEMAERARQEKFKQLLVEKEERLLKQKEDAARKRALAFKKAMQEKEERKRAEEQLKAKLGTPPYRKCKAPRLPTPDCYDSDEEKDEERARTTFMLPSWQNKSVIRKTFRYMRYAHSVKITLFCNYPQTPDLSEIFPLIEARKLKRTSSAVWNKSDLSRLEDIAEEAY